MSERLSDGTMHRQLLPWGARGSPVELRKQFRWVTWHEEPITYQQAEFHLGTGGPAACVVAVFRGPKGGWTGAQFVRRHDAMPSPRAMKSQTGRDGKLHHAADRTFYYGWVQMNVTPRGAYLPLPAVDHDRHRAHLNLHA